MTRMTKRMCILVFLNRSFSLSGKGLFVVVELFRHAFDADNQYRVREGERIVQGGWSVSVQGKNNQVK
jgi:hypothetical protein